jgi:hypothetical protein
MDQENENEQVDSIREGREDEPASKKDVEKSKKEADELDSAENQPHNDRLA